MTIQEIKTEMNLKLTFLNGEKEVVAEKEFLVPTVVQFKKRSEFTYGDLNFSYDLNSVSIKNINRKNFMNIRNHLSNFNNNDILYLHKVYKYQIKNYINLFIL